VTVGVGAAVPNPAVAALVRAVLVALEIPLVVVKLL
jgi:hypothetical protein